MDKQTRSANAYERAADRFSTAAENWRKARIDAVRILQDARQEYDAAAEELRRCAEQAAKEKDR